MSTRPPRYRVYLVRRGAGIWLLRSLWDANAADVVRIQPCSKHTTAFRSIKQTVRALDSASSKLGPDGNDWRGLVYDMQHPDPGLHPPVYTMAV